MKPVHMNGTVETTLRVAARLLTGSTYVLLGTDAMRTPGGRVQQAGPTLAVMRRFLPLPKDDELIVRCNGGALALTGGLLAAGKFPRVSALVMVGLLIPTTIAGHAFWTIEDPLARKLQRVQFQKNLAMIGGLLFAALREPTP